MLKIDKHVIQNRNMRQEIIISLRSGRASTDGRPIWRPVRSLLDLLALPSKRQPLCRLRIMEELEKQTFLFFLSYS